MKRTVSIFVIFLLLLWCGDTFATSTNGKTYVATAYGVFGDGLSLNTQAIQVLIDQAAEEGGGTIVFPKGDYLSGSLRMQSNVNIDLKAGATLLGSTNPTHYKQVEMPERPDSPKKDDNSQMAFIIAFNVHNFSIFGEGKIDGQGRALALNIDSLHHAGVTVDPKYNYRRMRPNETARPKLFRFSQCNNVTIKDLHLWNSACWGLSFELCRNLTLDNLKVLNRAYWNNDGMDITDCNNVRITNCDVNSADDGICLKSYYPGYCNDTIYIANCTVRSSASAIKFGTASYGGFKNVTIENIKVYDTFRSAIAIESVDGGIIENIHVSNIEAKNTGNAIFVRLGHRDGEQPGVIKNVSLKNIKVELPFGRPDEAYDMRGPAVNFFHNPIPSSISGLKNAKVEGITLENIEITCPGRASKGMAYVPLNRLNQVPEKEKDYPEFTMFGELPSWGIYLRHAKGITMKNVKLMLENEDYRPAIIFDQVKEINLSDIKLPDQHHKQIIMKETENVDTSDIQEANIKTL
ncbi:glycoside hydrolase family 28 protein [Puteibacter caeruleilacunae]|nr:glycoside hydrolase family 28 protein [Puteibacter caeruleilacunae]